MSDYRIKLSLFLLSMSFLTPLQASASDNGREDIGHYMFAQTRYFGPKIDNNNIDHNIDANIPCASRFYPNMPKHLFSYLKNNSRTIKESISYGDWDKPYRFISGFEYDYKRNKSSSSNYGYKDRSGSVFLLGDKAYYNNYIRLGGGMVLTHYNSDIEDIHSQKDDNAELVAYAIYNDAENQVRLRTRAYLGYGRTSLDRRAEIAAHPEARFTDRVYNYFYGFENSLSQTYQSGIFFFQPQIELNGLGIKRGETSEHGYYANALKIKEKNLFLWEGLLDLYVGIKGKDIYGNNYNIKAGPSFTRILSDPYDAFDAYHKYSGERIHFKSRYDKRDYITWKAYGNYVFENGVGLYSEFRYYKKDADSIAWGLGINYRF